MTCCATLRMPTKPLKVIQLFCLAQLSFIGNNPETQSQHSCFALADAKRNITEVENRLKNAEDKKKALQKDLQDVQNELNGLKTGRESHGLKPLLLIT